MTKSPKFEVHEITIKLEKLFPLNLQNHRQYTLPRNDLSCHLNWGAQVLMEISSNV